MTNPGQQPLPKVLLINDDPSIRAMIPMAIGGDYEVHTAETVAEGLAKAIAAQPPFNAVIADNRIPGETTHGIQDTAQGLTAANLDAGLLGYTSDMTLPTADSIYGTAGPDRPFEVIRSTARINELLAAIGRVVTS